MHCPPVVECFRFGLVRRSSLLELQPPHPDLPAWRSFRRSLKPRRRDALLRLGLSLFFVNFILANASPTWQSDRLLEIAKRSPSFQATLAISA
ncbi:hypothetical protein COO91_01974 [Nostoc flagelliforme CCNUN1]|uniref:Transmembrane protein n=1 Tax=Nostoc flagelliforme CCNUN1 TaxID=2038116 RepID=A0A2K8SMM1_9NOSO|nr:hypothetical protein COO91_01974 [Nostoc flagelliforme CCNUN1]